MDIQPPSMAAHPRLREIRPAELWHGLHHGLLAVTLLVQGACMIIPDDNEMEIEVVSGNWQTQGRERQLNEPVVVQVVDRDGDPAPGVRVNFWATDTNGSVNRNPVTTDSIGRAAVWWTLGDVVGAQVLYVTSPEVQRADSISATARQSDFDIHLVADAGFAPEQVEEIRAGTERWTEVVTGDMPDFRLPSDYRPPSRCWDARKPSAGSIDDMLIEVRVRTDLQSPMVMAVCEASESPVSVRPQWLYVLVTRSFVDRLHAESRLREWMAHLMGHGLGFGLFWGSLLHNPVGDAGVGADTHFPDEATVAAFDAAGGGAWTGGSKVPVENSEENRDIHWRGDVLGDELMSSWYTMGMPGDNPPLSAITVQAMGALGYEVDVSMADPYEVPGAGAMADQDQGPTGNGRSRRHGKSVELIYERGRVVGIVYR